MAADSRAAFIEEDEIALIAGIAYLFALAWASRSVTDDPVSRPGCTLGGMLR